MKKNQRAIRFTCKGEFAINFEDLPTASSKLAQLSAAIQMLRDIGMRGDFHTKLVTFTPPSRIGADGVWQADPEPGGVPLPTRSSMLEDMGVTPAFEYSHEKAEPSS